MYSRRFSDTDESLRIPPQYDGVALGRGRTKEPPCEEKEAGGRPKEREADECEGRGEALEGPLGLLPAGLGAEDLLLLGVALLLLFGQDNDPYIPLTLLLLFVLK